MWNHKFCHTCQIHNQLCGSPPKINLCSKHVCPLFFLAFTKTFIPIKKSEQRLVNMLSLMFFCWFYNYNHFFFCNPVITHCLPCGSIISTLWLNFTMNLISETMLYTGRIVTIKKIAMFASELKRVRSNKVAAFQLKKKLCCGFSVYKRISVW